MAEEHETGNEKLPGSGRTNEKPQNSPKRQRSPISWDFEPYYLPEPNANHTGRLRASSWDDSDDNTPPVPETPGCKTCRIYTSDDRKPRTSVTEIEELKKQFFLTREKEENIEGNALQETVNDNMEAHSDRRLSPARIRRRSRSSGSSSPVLEVENPDSPMQTNYSSGLDTEVLENISSNASQYDPTFYLNHFFNELKSKRISLIDPISVIESLEKDIPKYDSDAYNEISLDGKDGNSYLFTTPRTLPQIPEVEESRRDLQKSSEENLLTGFLQQCFGDNEVSSLPTARSGRNEKTEEGRQIQRDRYKSFSSEHLRTTENPQNTSLGSVTERCPRFFDGKLDHDVIGLSAKSGRTQLALPKCVDDREKMSPIQLFCVTAPNENDINVIDHLEDETNDTPRRSTDRSQQSRRSGNSGSYKAESPKFMLNIGRDSARSLKVEDMDDFQREENAEDSSFRKAISEDGSQLKTNRIPPLTIENPSVESLISTRRSFKEDEVMTNRSKNENSSQRSSRKSRKQTNNPPSEEGITPHTRHSSGRSQKSSPVDKSQRTSRKSLPKSTGKEVEGITTPNSKSSRIPKSSRTKTPKSSGTPRSNKFPELSTPIDVTETPESQKASPRSPRTTDTIRKDSDRSYRSYRASDRSSSSKSKPTGFSPRRLQISPKTSSRRSRDSLGNPDELESGRTHSRKESERVGDAVSNHSLISSGNSWREVEIPSQQHSYRSDVQNFDNFAMEITPKQQLSRSRNSSRISVNSNMTETEWKSPKQTISKESPSAIEQTHRSYHSEEDREDEEEQIIPESHSSTQRSKPGDDSDRLSHKRLSVINEVSVEDLETNQASTDSEENDAEGRPSTRQDTNRTSPERTSIDGSDAIEFLKPEKEQWNQLINEFHNSPKSFFLNKFPGFPPEKDVAWNARECVESKMDGYECDENSKENSFSRHKAQRALSFEKSISKNLNDLVYPASLPGKTRQEEFVQSPQNIYYVNLSKGGPFGIGEFGDVTCWNPGDFDTKELNKPKEHGDGITIRAPEVRLTEKEIQHFRDSTPLSKALSQEAADDEDFTHHIPCLLKPSKSDNCINKKVSGGDECQTPMETFLNGSQYKSDVPGFQENANKAKCVSKSTINQSSSSESLGSGKDWDNLEFAYERTPRLSRSLSNLDVRVQENIHDRTTSGTLSTSGSEPSKRSGNSSKPREESTGLNTYLARRARDDKMATKSGNWLKLKHTDAKHGKKTKTKFTKISKEPFHDYLSSRKGRTTVPALKLRNANCFQNFYKRFIGVFCLTSNSSAASSK